MSIRLLQTAPASDLGVRQRGVASTASLDVCVMWLYLFAPARAVSRGVFAVV